MDHINKLAGLFDDLIESPGVAFGGDGHAGEAWINRGRNHQRIDVVAPAGKDQGDPDQDTGFVGHEEADRVDVCGFSICLIFHKVTHVTKVSKVTEVTFFLDVARGYPRFQKPSVTSYNLILINLGNFGNIGNVGNLKIDLIFLLFFNYVLPVGFSSFVFGGSIII